MDGFHWWAPGPRQRPAEDGIRIDYWHEGFVCCDICGAVVPDNETERDRHRKWHGAT